MNLSENSFYKRQVAKRSIVRKGCPDESYIDTRYTRYTYESGKALYDVDVRNTDHKKTYHINCGGACEKHKIHKAIEVHFNL